METKLTLEHLAPYLPYGLKLKISVMNGLGAINRNFELDCGHDFNLHLSQGNIKPILKPLSDFEDINSPAMNDLNTDITIMIEICELANKHRNVSSCGFETVLEMARAHIDFRNLIPAGLAINANEINTNEK